MNSGTVFAGTVGCDVAAENIDRRILRVLKDVNGEKHRV
jgi:hypothetical protein